MVACDYYKGFTRCIYTQVSDDDTEFILLFIFVLFIIVTVWHAITVSVYDQYYNVTVTLCR